SRLCGYGNALIHACRRRDRALSRQFAGPAVALRPRKSDVKGVSPHSCSDGGRTLGRTMMPEMGSDRDGLAGERAGEADAKIASLRRTKLAAAMALAACVAVFAVARSLQGRYPWLSFV